MSGKHGWVVILAMIAGLFSGIGLGLLIGWVIAPVEYVDTDISFLHPAYKQELMLMVAEAYLIGGDLNTARARLALLRLQDPALAVADLAEQRIAQNGPLAEIQALATLASALDIQRDGLQPYVLPAQPDEPSVEGAGP
ncbi:MAG: hypothetical protein JW934_09125 [Anaerolineae bacterium]|nr:hypothetical protein [Anaerolineae bacterium]